MERRVRSVDLTVVRVLELCRDVELYTSEMYNFFAELFKNDHTAAALWKKTAQEEDAHANQFALAISMRKDGLIETVNIDLFKAETTLNLVKSIYDSVRKNPPTLIDTLRSAIKLENKLADFHMESVANFTDPSFKEMFSAMMKADKDHVRALQEAYDTTIKLGHASAFASPVVQTN